MTAVRWQVSTFRLAVSAMAVAFLTAGCIAGDAPQEQSPDHRHSDRGGIGVLQQEVAPVFVLPRRSLAVTDQVIVSTFTLRAVLDQLATQSGIVGLTGLQLFTQLWDTQNSAATGVTAGPHCTDRANTLNGFPYACRPAEGAQALNAAAIDSYSLIGLYNRFDLAPASGADCGEYRMVFGKTSGGGRAFIIFEAVLANPTPVIGLEGCRPVATMWAGLTTTASAQARAMALRNFYFTGLPGFSPVIHIDNYGNIGLARPSGQVRINEFIQQPWMLREFKLQKLSANSLLFVPVTVKTNPFGELFVANPASAQAIAFQNTFFPTQVEALARDGLNAFNWDVPDNFNTGESNSQNFGGTDDYMSRFSPASQLAVNIQARLTALGSPLTPSHIVARAQVLSCAGCHQLSNGAEMGGGLPSWPSSSGFVHSSESLENGPDGPRFAISGALTTVFLPHRARVLSAFLNRRPSASDYDGDRRAELSVYRAGPNTFNFLRSTSNFTAVTTKVWGQLGDVPFGSADYDGDNRSDMTFFRPSDATWNILTSTSNFTTAIVKTLGQAGDIPLAGGDYDGDGTSDITVFRPQDGTWNILTSSSDFTNTLITRFGVSADQPLAGADYDGDGRADHVVWRRNTRTMNVLTTSSATLIQRVLGTFGDVAVAGSDFDGDGRADMATWSPTTFVWSVRTSTSLWNSSLQVTWGAAGDVPLAGTDFDGDGRADFVVYRPSEGNWYILTSTSNYTASLVKRFGIASDVPLSR